MKLLPSLDDVSSYDNIPLYDIICDIIFDIMYDIIYDIMYDIIYCIQNDIMYDIMYDVISIIIPFVYMTQMVYVMSYTHMIWRYDIKLHIL